MKKIALFFGSFNPIHIGHLALANYLVEFTEVDELWFVVSPQNPHKNKSSLLDANLRYDMVYETIKDDSRFKVSNVEFSLPKPSYTCDTLVHLEEKFPENNFYLIIGADNLTNFHKWKNYEFILTNFPLLVYPRNEAVNLNTFSLSGNITLLQAPKIEISSSFIRKSIHNKKLINHFLHATTWKLIKKHGYYN